MGLDMYLSRKVYVGANYEHRHVKGNIEITVEDKPLHINFNKVSYITEEAAYWRKSNQIHKWSVDNVQDGQDDCKEYYVSRDKLQELLDLCKKVLETAKTVDGQVYNGETWSKGEHTYNYEPGKVIVNQEEIHELLPTESGFFFGGTDYDEYYIKDIQDTIEMLEPLLVEGQEGDFEYSSSW